MSRIQILDGGLGTSLVDKYDVTFDETTPLWSTHLLVDDQDTLFACQRDFVQAGAEVLLTATYQTSIEGFAMTRTKKHPLGISKSEIGPYLRGAVQVAMKAADGHENVRLTLSLGPYGACMTPGQEYTGTYDEAHGCEEALYHWHLERLSLFVETKGVMENIHMVAIETIPRADEIRAARRAIAASAITLPFWISCVFPGQSDQLPDGSTIDQAVQAMLEPATDAPVPWAIGINCTAITKLTRLARALESSVARTLSSSQSGSMVSLVLYPDGSNGKIYNTATKEWELSETPANSQASVKVVILTILSVSGTKTLF